MCQSELFSLNFYMLTISNSVVPTYKFEVLITQPLPKLATATTSTQEHYVIKLQIAYGFAFD